MLRRVAVVLPLGLVAVSLVVGLMAPACQGGEITDSQDLSANDTDLSQPINHPTHDLANDDGGNGGDLATVDMAKHPFDLAATDLAGLVNCYNVAICDPNMDFCIRYDDGSQAVPGKAVFGSPACFTPAVPCADNMQPMDCNCIQNDDALGMNCQGSCVDNGNGTFVCYQN
jgi:hypothetical protein